MLPPHPWGCLEAERSKPTCWHSAIPLMVPLVLHLQPGEDERESQKINQPLRRSLTGNSTRHTRGRRLGQEELGTGQVESSAAQGPSFHFGQLRLRTHLPKTFTSSAHLATKNSACRVCREG